MNPLAFLALATSCTAFVLPGLFSEPQEVFALNSVSNEEPSPLVDSQVLQDLITLEALNESAQSLYAIAETSISKHGHPTRVIGSPGHFKTIGYILHHLHQLKDYYTFDVQEFEALDGKVFNYSLAINGTTVDKVKPFQLTPAVHNLTGELFAVKNQGCNPEDYEGLYNTSRTPKVALIERGVCPFGEKSRVAGAQGAYAAIIYDNESPTDLVPGTLGEPTNSTVGALAIQRKYALEIIEALNAGRVIPVNVDIQAYVGLITTKNVIAETIQGDHENVVALGAHSDSVEAGPGINDDGSGTISLLVVAKELAKFTVNNAVRFAWWAAEEEGLLGSNYYANNLSPEENSKIRLFMDYDMMASPNFEYQIYNGSNEVDPKGSEEIKNLYIDWYDEHNKNWTLIPFDGRSDYVGFIEHGIPGGGIAAGAEGKNSQNGKVLDKCYHLLCDDLSNLNWDAFLTNTKLIAHSVATYAHDLSTFPKREISVEAVAKKEYNFKYSASHLVV